MRRRQALVWLLAAAGAARAASDAQGYETTSWPALLPPGWNTQAVLGPLRLDRIDDNDPQAEEILRKVRALLDNAPPNPDVHDRRLRLGGYMVPLQFVKQRHVSEFLLVPYYGACLHSPAPPANQVVHVTPAEPVSPEVRNTSAVWVAGTMKVVRSDSDLGAACYRMSGADVKPHKAG
ncbi:MAG TPA: DUF3299 domain-containing protein [Caldimonas sp.]|jgi:hypothetical protein|nr:DUF3299 domain-containing protein [Caldimonas sp.]HEX2539695.1 DUF3299 domain-containing protein [Caldimonas sp.]